MTHMGTERHRWVAQRAHGCCQLATGRIGNGERWGCAAVRGRTWKEMQSASDDVDQIHGASPGADFCESGKHHVLWSPIPMGVVLQLALDP